MEENLIKITVDKEKVESILRMTEINLERIKETNKEKYTSNILKDYYDVLREFMAIILLLDGFKTIGEGAHKTLIDYIEVKYKELNQKDIIFLNELRILRNKITYDGYFIEKEYLDRRWKDLEEINNKLKNIINKKRY